MAYTDPPRARQAGFGPPTMFDLTTLQRPGPASPAVYYLVPEPLPKDRPISWHTALGFGLVVMGGLGLGVLLVMVLL